MSQSQTQRSSRVDLLHGSILKSLLLFALPIMASRVFHSAIRRLQLWVPARRSMK